MPVILSETGVGKGGITVEVERSVESFLRTSAGTTSQGVRREEEEMPGVQRMKGRRPWVQEIDEFEARCLLLEVMDCRLLAFNNQQFAVNGYLAAIKLCHKLYKGGSCQPPTVWSRQRG